MKHYNILVFFIFSLLITQHINSNVITFFVKRYPYTKKELLPNVIVKKATKLKIHSTIPRYVLHHLFSLSGHIGIIATYAGYVVYSDSIGQVTFTRKHQEPFVDLVITKKIVPVMIGDKIIHHWEIPPNTQAAMYRIEKKQDKQTNLFFWQITPGQIPADGKISLESIVLFSKPENIYVPTGITITQDSPNLVLPTLYVKKGFDSVQNALYTINIRQFFETPQYVYKNTPYGYAKQLATLE